MPPDGEIPPTSQPGEDLEHLRRTLASQQRTNEALQETVDSQHRIIAGLRADAILKQEEIDALRSSTSWRITKPVRAAVDGARRTVWKLGALRVDKPVPPEGIKRLYKRFDRQLERSTRRSLRRHSRDMPALAQTLVSIVMPTHNRADLINKAIKSVLGQTHGSWELLIVDDGSTDDTEAVVAHYLDDIRIRYTRQDRSGVGAARNRALSLAEGEIVAYLDSDNEWDREFLSLMVAILDRDRVGIGYCATALTKNGKTVGYRGDLFDFEKCLDANYIDINSFCHRRALIDGGIAFDPRIRRTNDWDFILSLTLGRPVAYAPFVGVRYAQGERPDQISLQEPFVFCRLVERRHRRRFEGHVDELETFEEVLSRFPLTVAIRTASPRDGRELWGDHHLATGLARAIEKLGHSAEIYYLNEELRDRYDVVLVMRGLTEYRPTPEAVNVIWTISHPDEVRFEEYESFDIGLVASHSYSKMLAQVLGRPVQPVLQATDPERFHPMTEMSRERTLLFVGNSRNVDRPAVRYALDAGLPLAVHGSGWDGLIPPYVIRSSYLANQEAAFAYASAAAVLNDHWESMKDFGFVSNRVYDAVASGARVISDTFPELERMFGDDIDTFVDRVGFIEAAQRRLSEERVASSNPAALAVMAHHSLASRAEAILEAVSQFLTGIPTSVDSRNEPDRISRLGGVPTATPSLRVCVIPQMPVPGRMSSSAYIRLIQPLTSDLAGASIDLTVSQPGDFTQVRRQDVIVVSRTALNTIDEAEQLIELTDQGSRLIVDDDDAFHLMDESHPQFDEYQPRIGALMRLMKAAPMIWCSTQGLQTSLKSIGEATVIPNTIDPRLWRRYRQLAKTPRVGDRVELLYMGSATHGPDLELIKPILDEINRMYAGSFRLTVIGLPIRQRDPDWIRRLHPPRSSYPHFARWLRDLAPEFDVALAPLVDSEFNRLKSDIKILEYAALGLPAVASDVGPYRFLDSVDLCASDDDWLNTLEALITDRVNLDERRLHAEHAESEVWRKRRAATAGDHMTRLLAGYAVS